MNTWLVPDSVRAAVMRANIAVIVSGLAVIATISAFSFLYLEAVGDLKAQVATLQSRLEKTRIEMADNHKDAVARIERVAIGDFSDVVIPVIRAKDLQIVGTDDRIRIRSYINEHGNPVVNVLDENGQIGSQIAYRTDANAGNIYVRGFVNIESAQQGGVIRIFDRNGFIRAGMGYNASADASSLDTYSGTGEIQTLIGNQPSGPYIQLFSGGAPALSFTRSPEGYVQTYTKQDPAKDVWGFVSMAATAHWVAQRLGIMR